ncbi:MAG: DUF6157 family protein [Bacteroidota bacterium]
MHSTNYFNTFIEIAEDSPTQEGQMPPIKGEKKSVANMQFDMLYEQPYQHSSDDVIFSVWATRKGITKAEWDVAREEFFSKGQACFRASPLTKRYGWGIHSNAEGKVAMFPAGSPEYATFMADDAIKKVKAMRSKRK